MAVAKEPTGGPVLGDLSTYAMDGHLILGLNEEGGAEVLSLALANRHGLITGATGTGKTVTLQVLAEAFSSAGVPVFAADIKGDLSGIAALGTPKPPLAKRVEEIGLEGWGPQSFPTVFWDVFGEQGHPVRATVQDMGPLVISRLLELSEAQEGVMNIAFRWAADQRAEGGKRMRELHLIDLDDLRAVLATLSERAAEIRTEYGNVAPASVGAIQRRLLVLEEQGANNFFGEPALDISDFLRVADDGRGVVNILAADKLFHTPKLYSTFLLWMLTTLYEHLPEVGDLPKPKLVFFFDEAHLLFDGAPKALLDKIEQVTRLIPARQSHPARPARLHAARPESRAGGGVDLQAKSGVRDSGCDHASGRRRGAGLDARRQGRPRDGRAPADRAAGQPDRPDRSDRTRGGYCRQPARRQI